LTALKDGHLNTFVQNITEAGVDDVIVPIKSSTHKAARIFEKGKYPFIFIDSGHGYNTVYKDMELYWPLISEGGTFAGHDFYGDTRRAVEDFFKTLDMSVESVGGSWRVRKGI
jgi:predicted O-methyltransferase YrrM